MQYFPITEAVKAKTDAENHVKEAQRALAAAQNEAREANRRADELAAAYLQRQRELELCQQPRHLARTPDEQAALEAEALETLTFTPIPKERAGEFLSLFRDDVPSGVVFAAYLNPSHELSMSSATMDAFVTKERNAIEQICSKANWHGNFTIVRAISASYGWVTYYKTISM